MTASCIRCLLRRLPAFEGGQAELEPVDPVPEDLELGLVGQPPFRGAAQAR
jgi:hypothetical protein